MASISLDALREKAIEGKPRIKTWRWKKPYMDVRSYWDLCFEEEVIKVQEEVKVQIEKEELSLEKSFPKAPIQLDNSIVPHIQKFMEGQVQIQQIEALRFNLGREP